MADDEDVPPLEDMTEVLEQVKALSHKPKQSEQTKEESLIASFPKVVEQPIKDPAQTEKENQAKAAAQVKKNAQSSQSSGFGGMKKGFLFGGPSKPKPKPTTQKPKDDIPLLKPKQTKEEERRIPEVQEAMMGNFLEKNKDKWMTEALLQKVQKNDTLMKQLGNPKFMAALTEFQHNPKAAAEKYKDNPEIDKFFRDFSGIIGDHLTKLGEETPQKPPPVPAPAIQSEDESRMQEILANPEVREIFNDPRVQKLFEVLRTDPDSAQRFIREADPVLQQRLRKLVEVGLLQIER